MVNFVDKIRGTKSRKRAFAITNNWIEERKSNVESNDYSNW